MFDKSLITNLIALIIIAIALFVAEPWREPLLFTGLFAFSGALTNWLAIHMLFEKVPGFYGSGVIPARFEEFKSGIRELIMEQFFNPDNIRKFFEKLHEKPVAAEEANEESAEHGALNTLMGRIDFSKAFDSLVEVIMNSSFAGMLSMFGGADALQPLRDPFIDKMKEFLTSVSQDKEMQEQFKSASIDTLSNKIAAIVDQRLDELTPELVKEIIQQMIRKHLGWLVVWGGVIGGLIGLCSTLLFQ